MFGVLERTNPVLLQGHLEIKPVGARAEDSYCHLSTTLTKKIRSESVNRKPSGSVNQQKRVVKLVKSEKKSGKYNETGLATNRNVELCQKTVDGNGSISCS